MINLPEQLLEDVFARYEDDQFGDLYDDDDEEEEE